MTTEPTKEHSSAISQGLAALRQAVAVLPAGPGVYRMQSATGKVLYVGKAKNLKKRVTSYTQLGRLPERLLHMVAETRSLEIVTTASEADALLLEANFIKHYRPRYNVLLLDDKSYPYIVLTGDHPFPRLGKHRGQQDKRSTYFGPFASISAVHTTLDDLQRAFLLRNCSDQIFKNRTRPCLQYHIKRCTAPCVARVSEADYAAQVKEAVSFLSGQSRAVQDRLQHHMLAASQSRDYERAASLRDRIKALTAIQAQQLVNLPALADADLFALARDGGQTAVMAFFFRAGCNFGNRVWFLTQAQDIPPTEALSSFIAQFYDERPVPPLILPNLPLGDTALLSQALGARAGHKVRIETPQRGARLALMQEVERNAAEALCRHLADRTQQDKLLEGVAEAFGLQGPPARIEVYDNSHTGGTQAIGGMIVAGAQGFIKNAYRKFNMRAAQSKTGDDFAMMREMLERRFKEAVNDPTAPWPDLLLIDGGQGQLTAVLETLAELGVADLPVVAIAKGPDRNAGRERFFMAEKQSEGAVREFALPFDSPVLYFLQRLRDEAHRFAIGVHRARRQKALTGSPLDDIAGIGAARKRALLLHFGSAQAVARAGLADIAKVAGISAAIAKKIHDHFHSG